MAYTVSVVTIYPGISETSVSRNTVVSVTFNRDLLQSSLSGNVKLEKKVGDSFENVAGAISYSNKVATLKPEATLDAATIYRVTIIGDVTSTDGVITGVLDVFGNGMLGNFVSTFETSIEPILDKPVITVPITNTTITSVPAITWTTAPSATSYVLQMSPASDFSVDYWNTTVNDPAVLTVTPGVVLVEGPYFIRMRYTTVDGTSPWSDTVKFYYDIYVQPSEPALPDEDSSVEEEEPEPIIYEPLYADFNDVYMDIYPLAGNINKQIIYKAIRDASLYAKEVRLKIEEANPQLTAIDWDDIANLPYYIKQFVRYQAGYDAYLTSYMERTSSLGESRQLGDFMIQSTFAVTQDVNNIFDLLKQRIQPWLDQLMNFGFSRKFALPKSCTKGETSNPYQDYHTRSTFTGSSS